ncbi:MAG: hypothetical protein ACRDQZ_10990 [Mycobacteriales bacterium]
MFPYSYLWSHESDDGRDDPAKERRRVVVLAVGEGDHPQVTVAPITSRYPGRPEAIALDASIIGLDRASWIVPWELNVFRWPGPDVGRAPNHSGAWWRLGTLTPNLRRKLRVAVEAALNARKVRIVRRTE